MAEQNPEFRYLVRVANTDLDGNKSILQGLRKIKGISFMFANAVCHAAKVDAQQKAGYAKEGEIKKIEAVLENPSKFDIPSWFFNRRKDVETGADKHVLSGDLKFNTENDIKQMKKIRSYKGMRHAYGLPVRGQRTKSNFRKNKGNVLGVKRRSGSKAGKV